MTQSNFTIVIGSKARSRNGCINCKRSKKKCDEKYPICGLCEKRCIACKYEIFREAKVRRPPIAEEKFISENDNSKQIHKPESKITESKITELERIPHTPDYLLQQDIDRIIDDQSDLMPLQDDLDLQMTTFNVQPTSSFNLYLDETGIQFLQYFENNVSKLLTVDQDSSNYFLKTFLQVSLTEESVSHALACWGGIFKSELGLEDSKVKDHYERSLSLVKHLKPTDNLNLYILLCFYQILIGIKVCVGDVKHWHMIFKTCSHLIMQNGGIQAVLEKFSYSNDIKWLISNHEYHDIFNSRTFSEGTLFPIDQYTHMNFYNYGMDPFQGCHNSVVLILGEILNEKTVLRYLTLQETQAKFEELLFKLESCEPVVEQVVLLQDDDKNKHLDNFNLYKVVVKMILLSYFKKAIPASLDIQVLALEGMDLIQQLTEIKLFACLTLPFFILGLNLINSERLVYMDLLENTLRLYNVGNLKRVRDVIRIFWSRNENGQRYIDWVDIVKELNWELCLA